MYGPEMNRSADPHLSTDLEGYFVLNRGERPQSDEVEKSRVPEVSFEMPVWKIQATF